MAGGFYQSALLPRSPKTKAQVHARAPKKIVKRHSTSQTLRTDQWLANGSRDFHTADDLIAVEGIMSSLASGTDAAFQRPA
jgi:hypothetical protein